MTYISANTILNAADWHATQALKAYRKRDYSAYTRHIRIADDLRRGYEGIF
jgi:hypothetical protein